MNTGELAFLEMLIKRLREVEDRIAALDLAPVWVRDNGPGPLIVDEEMVKACEVKP